MVTPSNSTVSVSKKLQKARSASVLLAPDQRCSLESRLPLYLWAPGASRPFSAHIRGL
jgi:hypothetical protein